MEASALPIPSRRPGLSPRLLRVASDERLVSMVRSGSEPAFEALYDRYHAPILSFARHMVAGREEAEDVVQHTFIAAYRDLVGSAKAIQLRPWLYAIARNRCLSVLRSRREHLDVALVEPATEGLATEVQHREDLRLLVGDLARLPEDQRAALILSELGGMGHADIASVVGCSRGNVKSLVFQARSSLIDSRAARETPCEEIREQIAALRGGALRRNRLRRHLRECSGCREFREQVREQRKALAAVMPVTPSLGLKECALAKALFGGAGGGGAVAGGCAVSGGIAGAGVAALSGKSVAAVAAAVGVAIGGTAGLVQRQHVGLGPAPPVASGPAAGAGVGAGAGLLPSWAAGAPEGTGAAARRGAALGLLPAGGAAPGGVTGDATAPARQRDAGAGEAGSREGGKGSARRGGERSRGGEGGRGRSGDAPGSTPAASGRAGAPGRNGSPSGRPGDGVRRSAPPAARRPGSPPRATGPSSAPARGQGQGGRGIQVAPGSSPRSQAPSTPSAPGAAPPLGARGVGGPAAAGGAKGASDARETGVRGPRLERVQAERLGGP